MGVDAAEQLGESQQTFIQRLYLLLTDKRSRAPKASGAARPSGHTLIAAYTYRATDRGTNKRGGIGST